MPVAAHHETVLAELDRVLAWPEMARSPQLGRFLEYIVRRTLEGEDQTIKAYSIAVDVFGRPADFDPQADPIVRVQARRLRSLLEQYYASVGATGAVRITLPVGRYVPVFASVETAEDVVAAAPEGAPHANVRGRSRADMTLSWPILLPIALGIAALAYALSSWEPRQEQVSPALADTGPSITIVEFQDLSGTGNKPVVAGLALELVTDLQAFEDINVRYSGGVSMAQPVSSC